MCRVKMLRYTKCNHTSDVIPAYPDEWCQYKQAYPDTPFKDCPNSNKGADVQTYPEFDWCAACKDLGMHRGEIEARAQALRATIQTQGIQAIIAAAPVYQPLQPDPYQDQSYHAAAYQQPQIQHAPDPNEQQQIQYQPDPNQQPQYQQNTGYQADPGYYPSAPGSPLQAGSPSAPGSPLDQSHQADPAYQADLNVAAGQQPEYPGAPGGPGSPESVGQIFDSIFTPPANPYNPNYPGHYPR